MKIMIIKRWSLKEEQSDNMNQSMENEHLILVKEKAEQTILSVRDVCVFPLMGCKDDSSVNSTDDVILLDEENKYPKVIAVASITVYQLVNITEFIQNIS